MSYIRHPSVGNETVGGEDRLAQGDVLWNGGRRRVIGVALGTALKQVEVLTVGGKLYVDRVSHNFLKRIHHLLDPLDERRVRYQSLESCHQLVVIEINIKGG